MIHKYFEIASNRISCLFSTQGSKLS